jgi:hypothetical protein
MLSGLEADAQAGPTMWFARVEPRTARRHSLPWESKTTGLSVIDTEPVNHQ